MFKKNICTLLLFCLTLCNLALANNSSEENLYNVNDEYVIDELDNAATMMPFSNHTIQKPPSRLEVMVRKVGIALLLKSVATYECICAQWEKLITLITAKRSHVFSKKK